MKYFFILGNNPALSLAEISAIFKQGKAGRLAHDKILFLNSAEKINEKALIKKMGGTIKIGLIYKKTKAKDLFDAALAMLEPKDGKYLFGFSCYGQKKFNIKPLAMDIKKHLKNKGIASRWITSREPYLSSVVVEQNGLVAKGIEIVIVADNNDFYLGKTLAVQPFKELSFRDYGRPARDDKSGMLPPKLAQIMINLSDAGRKKSSALKDKIVLLDPFCGSGTILTEALLMGYKNIIGSDISKKAIKDTEKNIAWIKSQFQISNFKFRVFKANTKNISQYLDNNSIDAVVTEPYLGPPRGRFDIKKTVAELEELYSKTLRELKKILKNNGRVVIVFPVFMAKGSKKINPDISGFKITSPLPEYARKYKLAGLTGRNTIVYGRPGQKVWREIIILTKINN